MYKGGVNPSIHEHKLSRKKTGAFRESSEKEDLTVKLDKYEMASSHIEPTPKAPSIGGPPY
jgi:hypothetical protein